MEETSDELCARIRDISPDVILFFSGKDSIASLIQMRRFWDKRRIHLVHGYLVPGLKHIEEPMREYERIFGQHIIMVPHPFLPVVLREYVYQTEANCDVIDAIADRYLVEYSWDDISEIVIHQLGLAPSTWSALGVTRYDSQNRWSSFKRFGAANHKRRVFYPIFDWPLARILEEIARSGWKLPPFYRAYGRSLDGLDYRFTDPMSRFFPEDFALLKQWFPLIEAEILKIRWREEMQLHAA